jgi:hypothetical protein
MTWRVIRDILYTTLDWREVYLGKYRKGSYYPIFSVHVLGARKIEHSLHKKYADKNSRPCDKATKIGIARDTTARWKQIQQTGSGSTEWFLLKENEILAVKIYLFLISIRSWFRVMLTVGFFLTIISLGCIEFVRIFGHAVFETAIK